MRYGDTCYYVQDGEIIESTFREVAELRSCWFTLEFVRKFLLQIHAMRVSWELSAQRRHRASGEQGLEKEMSDKITIVVGHKTIRPSNWNEMTVDERYNSNWKAESFHRSGFWKKETIVALARKLGFIGEIKVVHTCMDYSGKGRTYKQHEEVIAL